MADVRDVDENNIEKIVRNIEDDVKIEVGKVDGSDVEKKKKVENADRIGMGIKDLKDRNDMDIKVESVDMNDMVKDRNDMVIKEVKKSREKKKGKQKIKLVV